MYVLDSQLCPHLPVLKVLKGRPHFGNPRQKQSQELTKVNPDRNIFSINVELTSTFLLYRGLVHRHHRILKRLLLFCVKCKMGYQEIMLH